MKSEQLLKDKVCIITGTSSGIGKSIAEKYASQGAIVFANARKHGSIDEWAEETGTTYNGKIIPQYYDVTDFSSTREAVLAIKKEYNKIDVLINNAGKVSYELVSMVNFDSLREMLEVNVVSMIHLIQLVSRIMGRQKAGSIINISSITGVKGVSGQLAYSASKGAVNALTMSAAKELAPQNIRVNAIAPGMIGTDRLLNIMESKFKDKIDAIGMGRIGKPEDVSNACLFLGSDLSEYLTGQIIGVDGSTIL